MTIKCYSDVDNYVKDVSSFDRHFLNELRGASILRVMMVHLGLSWFYMPYSSYIGALLPLLFFISGVVTFFSFRRSTSVIRFAYNRLVSILVPYFLLFCIIYILSFFLADWHIGSISSWLWISPETSSLPFSLGQVWFLQSLSLIIILTLPLFIFSKRNQFSLVIYCACIVALICQNTYESIHEYFIYFQKIDLYLALSNSFFFILGSVYFIYKDKFTKQALLVVSAIGLISGCAISFVFYEGSLGIHMESPDLVYVLCSTSIILMIFSCSHTLQRYMTKCTLIERLFMYCSKHSYSLYLLHTLVLAGIERFIYPEALTGDVFNATCRMLLVIVISLVISPFYTHISSIIIRKVRF